MSGKIISGKLSRGHRTDAGQDVYSAETITILPRDSSLIRTGLKIAVPEGSVGLLKSRSGLSVKHKLEVGAGVIDSGYRGEVRVHLYNHSDKPYLVSKGDRVAQLITFKIDLDDYVECNDTEHETDRGESGFGSTGNT